MDHQSEGDTGIWPPPQSKGRSRSQQLWFTGAIMLAAGIVLCLCTGILYLAAQQFLNRSAPVDITPLPVPTRPGGELTPTFPPDAPTPSEPTAAPTLEIAPTVTVPGDATLEPPAGPPTGDGNVNVPRFAGEPVIDGNLGEWIAVPSVESQYRVYTVEGWDGSADLEAVWQLGWTDQYLFVGVRVMDDIHVQTQTGTTIFRGDSLEMQLDTDRAGDFGDGLSPDDYQLVLSPGDFGGIPPQVVRFRGDAGGGIPEAPGHSIQVAAEQLPNGYTLEARIPWSDLGLTPAVEMVIGASLNANDNDSPGEAIQEVMESHVPGRTFSDPTTWGSLTLQ